MILPLAVLSGFVLAAVAPWVYRVAGRHTGLALALLPAGLTAYFASQVPSITNGEALTSSRDWVPSLGVNFSFYADGLGLLFALLISGIGALVLVYSGSYLGGHPHLGRFCAFILLFMASMLGLVLADDVITLFVFWELTSVSSYLLIGFDHERQEARRAALQALLVTGVGGLALLAGLLLLAQAGASAELSILIGRGELVRDDPLYLAILLLVLSGAFTKSAQVPFHFWLPNAMEAPTPVSAYLHSATMVKAGVYLLARLSPVLGGTDTWLWVVTGVGAATMVIGAHLALQQNDLKRLLAYSTVSVLGMLTMLLGLGEPLAVEAAVVILLGHALYKGALFLVAGAVDHETGDREVDRLGGLFRVMPVTGSAAVLAALSMAGLPPLFGFIGKESLYEAALHAPASLALVLASLVASALLVASAGNAGLRPFIGAAKASPREVHEAPLGLWAPPMVLAALGLTLGLAPGIVDGRLLSPATEAVLGQPTTVDLSLWHGLNRALGLSAVTVMVGLAAYMGYAAYRDAGLRLAAFARLGADQLYDLSLDGLNWLARAQTRALQSGYLRFYLLTIVAATVAVVSYAFLDRGGLDGLAVGGDVRFYEVAVVAMILAGALLAVLTISRLAALAALGVVGYGIGLVYLLFGAPDLAMAQILVESLIVILFVLVFYHLPRFAKLSAAPARARDVAVALAAGLLMTGLVLVATNTERETRLSDYYAETGQPEAHGRNIVNVILVDFRALDTLGEITVLAVAGIGVFALLKLRDGSDR
jgi:multicomponent Na+:H+ antiporter subunit A